MHAVKPHPHRTRTKRSPLRDAPAPALRVPPGLRGLLVAAPTPEAFRAALVRRGWCDGRQAPVVVELYGGLRLKSGCDRVPLHADSVAEALAALERACPEVRRLLPPGPELLEHYRFAVNGRHVVSDLAHPLRPGDHLILFSASVGG